MLVLSRKLDQTIQIGDQITVTVVSVKGNTVRLGISAPAHVRVTRSELLEKPGSRAGRCSPSPEALDGSGPAGVFGLESKPNAPITFGLRSGGTPSQKSLADLFPAADYQVHHLRIPFDKVPGSQPTADDVQQV